MNTLVTTQQAVQSTDHVEGLIQRFTAEQDVKPASRQLYRRTLRRFFAWLNGRQLSTVTRAEIVQYRDELLASGMSVLTVSSYLTSVRRFYEWTEAHRLYPNVAKAVRTPKKAAKFQREALRPEQASSLLSYYQHRALRDYAIVSLLLRTGLRTIELSRANIGDIQLKGGQRVLLVHGKGRDAKDQYVVLTDKAYQPIDEYLAARGDQRPSEPLFTSESNNSTGGRITTRTISHIAKEGLRAIGLDHRAYTAHSLRHTAAVSILRAGGKLEDAQLALRHANIATTQIYTHHLNEERRLANSGEAMLDNVY